MTDLLVIAGQALSVVGLIYGWYLSLLYCGDESEVSAVRGDATVLHQLAVGSLVSG